MGVDLAFGHVVHRLVMTICKDPFSKPFQEADPRSCRTGSLGACFSVSELAECIPRKLIYPLVSPLSCDFGNAKKKINK